MTLMESRHARVMVKLDKGGPPDEVLFTDSEREAVATAAMSAGYAHPSTFIRELGVEAAVGVKAKKTGARALLKAAAHACGIPLGRWLREVTLAGIGQEPVLEETPLPLHRREASKWFQRKVKAAT